MSEKKLIKKQYENDRIILENKIVKFVPLSNLEYDVEVKLLNEEKEFYKFF